jgi:hypothetical protein
MKTGLRIRACVPTQENRHSVSRNAQLNQVTVCDFCLAFQFSRFPMNRYVRKSGRIEFSIGTGQSTKMKRMIFQIVRLGSHGFFIVSDCRPLLL